MVYDKAVDFAKAGKRIKLARIERDWSQEVLAERADISVTFLSNVENAHSKASLATFVKIANALERGVDDLLCDSIKECRYELNNHLAKTVSDCTDYEMRIVVGAVTGLIHALRDAESYKKRLEENEKHN
jgi:transcriptional regulator with XRE-family HTH domain